MQEERRSNFKLLCATVAAAALALCDHAVLAAQYTPPPLSLGGQTRKQTAMPYLPAEQGAHLRADTFETPSQFLNSSQGIQETSSTPSHPLGSLNSDQGNQEATSTPLGRLGLPAPLLTAEEGLTPLQPPKVESEAEAAKSEVPAPSSAFASPVENDATGVSLPPAGRKEAPVFPGPAELKTSASLFAPLSPAGENGAAEENKTLPFASFERKPEGFSGLLANSEFLRLTPDAFKAMCEQTEADATAAVDVDELNVTCISGECNTSNEEHTQAKSATMEGVCRLSSLEESFDFDTAASKAIRLHAKDRIEQVFSANIKRKVIVAVGIPSNLLSIAQSASQVIVIEMDRAACESFLASKEGICILRRPVQFVCMKPNTMTTERRAELTFEIAEKIIRRHFHAVPPDLVLISSDYPVAIATKLFEEVDQSTTLIVHHRLSFLALQALAPLYRQELYVHPNVEDENVDPRSFVLFRRTYGPPVDPDHWRTYLKGTWRLAPDENPIKLLTDSTKLAVEAMSVVGDADGEKLIRLYFRTLRQFWTLASDDERKSLRKTFDSINRVVQRPDRSTKLLKGMYGSAAKSVADKVVKFSTLRYYFGRLRAKISYVDPNKRIFYHALFDELVVASRKVETTDVQRRALRKLLREVDTGIVRDLSQLPRLLHTVRMAVETFNDVKDARLLLQDTEQRCSLTNQTLKA